MTVEDCGHGPVGGCCSKLWVGSHIIRQKNPVLKFVLQDLIFMDFWNKRNNDGAGGEGASVCGAVRWGPVTAQDT